MWNHPALQIPWCTGLWTHIFFAVQATFSSSGYGERVRGQTSLCVHLNEFRVTTGGISPLEWGNFSFNHPPLHHAISSQWSFILHNSIPSNCTTSGKAPAPQVRGETGRWVLEISQSVPIFLWSSALSVHCPDLTDLTGGLNLWMVTQSLLQTLIFSLGKWSWLRGASSLVDTEARTWSYFVGISFVITVFIHSVSAIESVWNIQTAVRYLKCPKESVTPNFLWRL